MSGLVDRWTSELAKLREKGPTTLSNGSSPGNGESSQVGPVKEANLFSAGKLSSFVKEMRVNSLTLPYSEAAVSMLVECFSP
ncbi:hypothetical protein ACOSQ4_005532 [Xanthoceras sorbifolium]